MLFSDNGRNPVIIGPRPVKYSLKDKNYSLYPMGKKVIVCLPKDANLFRKKYRPFGIGTGILFLTYMTRIQNEENVNHYLPAYNMDEEFVNKGKP